MAFLLVYVVSRNAPKGLGRIKYKSLKFSDRPHLQERSLNISQLL
ncbi:MAG: hypothetical protein ACRAVC_25100 [Trichormus sp.]